MSKMSSTNAGFPVQVISLCQHKASELASLSCTPHPYTDDVINGFVLFQLCVRPLPVSSGMPCLSVGDNWLKLANEQLLFPLLTCTQFSSYLHHPTHPRHRLHISVLACIADHLLIYSLFRVIVIFIKNIPNLQNTQL